MKFYIEVLFLYISFHIVWGSLDYVFKGEFTFIPEHNLIIVILIWMMVQILAIKESLKKC